MRRGSESIAWLQARCRDVAKYNEASAKQPVAAPGKWPVFVHFRFLQASLLSSRSTKPSVREL